jgi:16S rRNA (cytosine967-C5)-methyltransferase
MPGQRVLDLCAAPGGKAFPLACRLGEDGCVVAVDNSPDRLQLLRVNRERLGIPTVHPVAADLEERLPFTGRFARILLDAPCSGTGTLGRRPEIRWRLQPRDLVSLAGRQARFLQKAGHLLQPGGLLLYAVCSLESEEGKDQIDRFLLENPGFALADLSWLTPASLRSAITPEGAFQTWPHRHGTDGFFAALLRRVS